MLYMRYAVCLTGNLERHRVLLQARGALEPLMIIGLDKMMTANPNDCYALIQIDILDVSAHWLVSETIYIFAFLIPRLLCLLS